MNKSSGKTQTNENALKKMDSSLSQYLFDQRENSMVHAKRSDIYFIKVLYLSKTG